MHDRLLSFAAYDDEGVIENGWLPAENDNFAEGERRASEMLDHLSETSDVPTFVRVMRDAVKSETEGIQTVKGFIFGVGDALS